MVLITMTFLTMIANLADNLIIELLLIRVGIRLIIAQGYINTH